MKIVEIRAAGLRGATPKGGWANDLQAQDCSQTIIVVRTDEGVKGIGTASTTESLVHGALELLLPTCVGQDAMEPERLSETLRQNTFWFGRGGAVEHSISGIDIALWDIFGQVTKQPIGRLLGGYYRTRVRAYASILMSEPSKLSAELVKLRKAGFSAFKIGWGPFGRESNQLDEKIVDAARSAVGEKSLLMIDAGGSDAYWRNGYKWALRTADMLSMHDIGWFEEPLPPDDIDDYAELRRRSRVPIASGEVLTRRATFKKWLKEGAVDIVQPDATHVGGISEVRRISVLAQEFGVRLIPHGWNTAIGLAVDLQLAGAFSDTDMVEYQTGSAYIDGIAAHPWALDADGFLEIPQSPGLGVVLNPDEVEKYTGAKGLLRLAWQ